MKLAKRSVLLAALGLQLLSSVSGQGDFVSRIIAYCPAPGQHINDSLTGTPSAADRLKGGVVSPVSLGAFGGYLILGFDHTIENDPANPYGIDFTVFGNAFSGSSEPGIVRVMKDMNGNGLPDDTWYEIAGSRHVTGPVTRRYQLVYYNNRVESSGDIFWRDNLNDSGSIRHNSFHPQPYYPAPQYFPFCNQDSLVFTGNRIHIPVSSENGILKTEVLLFGYADNHASIDPYSSNGPDNPYTPDVLEGTGGDPIDISWAVDTAGHYIDLDGIDFVMIMSAVNEEAGPLGEVSTDVAGVKDVAPDLSLQGQTSLISLENVPSEISVQTHFLLKPVFFDHGRPRNTDFIISSSDPAIARINPGYDLETLSGGSLTITVHSVTGDAVATKVINVVQPSRLETEGKFSFLTPGERGIVAYTVFDQDGKICSGIIPSVTISDSSVINISAVHEGQIEISGIRPGKAGLALTVPGSQRLTDTLQIRVVDNEAQKEVSVSVKLSSERLLPRKNYLVKRTDILPYLADGADDYQDTRGFISLADVLADVFLSNGFDGNGNTFRFRRDSMSDGLLYLWQVGKDWEFFYGWGGNTVSAPYRKCWVVSVNDTVYLNDFDQIPVDNDDIISVYLINDLFDGWDNLSLYQKKEDITDSGGIIIDYRLHHYDLDPLGGIVIRKQDLPGTSLFYANDEAVGMVRELTIPGSHAMKFVPETGGQYTLTIEDYPYEAVRVETAGISGAGSLPLTGVQAYPNPFNDYIQISTNTTEPVRIMITDLTGKMLYRGETRGDHVQTIDTRRYPPGAYILKMQQGQKTTGKILIRQ